jgi:hypothetical protein
VLREGADFLKAVEVDKLLYALARREQASRMMLFDPLLAAAQRDLGFLMAKLGDLFINRWLWRRNQLKGKGGRNSRIRGHVRFS